MLNQDLLHQILTCPALPTLPAVAVRIIEFSGRAEVPLIELARLIEKDQALSAKVLRLVNSSYFGLSRPCSTIGQAVVLLGQRKVRQVALTFSLVGVMRGVKAGVFDFDRYWRRSLYTAVAAQTYAAQAAMIEPDEAFLAGLLQDLGQFALFRAMGSEYERILERTGGDHRCLGEIELAELDITHSEVGACLAERWKFPASIVGGIRYHDRATAAPREHADLCRCVMLGNLAHDVLTDAEPAVSIDRLCVLGREWFDASEDQTAGVLTQVAEQARTLSPLLGLNTGPYPDAAAIVARAADLRRGLARTFPPQRDAA